MASPICPGQSSIKNASWVWSVMLQRDMSLFQGKKIGAYNCPLSRLRGALEGAAQGIV